MADQLKLSELPEAPALPAGAQVPIVDPTDPSHPEANPVTGLVTKRLTVDRLHATLDQAIAGVATNLTAHAGRVDNPHAVTAAQVGAATSDHTHTGVYQPADATLTALAALDGTAGLLEQTGADTFARRALGVGAASSVLTRGDGDSRYATASHSHTFTDTVRVERHSATTFHYAYLDIRRSLGTQANPLPVTAGVNVGGLNAYVYYNGTWGFLGQVLTTVASTTANGPVGRVVVMVNDGSGANSSVTLATLDPTAITLHRPATVQGNLTVTGAISGVGWGITAAGVFTGWIGAGTQFEGGIAAAGQTFVIENTDYGIIFESGVTNAQAGSYGPAIFLFQVTNEVTDISGPGAGYVWGLRNGSNLIAGVRPDGSLKIGTASTVGHVWTATDTQGHGAWQAPTGGTGAVDSVDGRTGAVTLGDLYQPLGSYAAAVHSHAIGDVTGLATALEGLAAADHGHAIEDITGLQSALDSKQAAGSYATTAALAAHTSDTDNPHGVTAAQVGALTPTGDGSGLSGVAKPADLAALARQISYPWGGASPTTGAKVEARRRVARAATAIQIEAGCSGTRTGDCTIRVLKSTDGGATWPTTVGTITLSDSEDNDYSTISVALAAGDYLCAEVVSVGGAATWWVALTCLSAGGA